MSGKPLSHDVRKENGFKQPDRVDRHPHSNTDRPADNRPPAHTPNSNNDAHKPKIVPWK